MPMRAEYLSHIALTPRSVKGPRSPMKTLGLSAVGGFPGRRAMLGVLEVAKAPSVVCFPSRNGKTTVPVRSPSTRPATPGSQGPRHGSRSTGTAKKTAFARRSGTKLAFTEQPANLTSIQALRSKLLTTKFLHRLGRVRSDLALVRKPGKDRRMVTRQRLTVATACFFSRRRKSRKSVTSLVVTLPNLNGSLVCQDNQRANLRTSCVIGPAAVRSKVVCGDVLAEERCHVGADRDALEYLIARILHVFSPKSRQQIAHGQGLLADNDKLSPQVTARIPTPQIKENRFDNLGMIDACVPCGYTPSSPHRPEQRQRQPSRVLSNASTISA